MARLDTIHDAVKNALIKDGWMITDDPYIIVYEEFILFADLAAEKALAAEKEGRKIVVEIKSFLHPSPVQDLKTALGQYQLYLSFLEVIAPERQLYIAVSEKAYTEFFKKKAVRFVIERQQMPLLVVDVNKEEVVRWID